MDPYASPSKFSPKILIALAGGLLLLLIIIYVMVSQAMNTKTETTTVTPTLSQTATNANNALPTRTVKPANVPKDAVAKVGKEYIYQYDVDSLTSDYSNVTPEEAKKSIIEKLVKDSIILQAAASTGVIALDDTIFNSPTKNIQKRQQAVNTSIEKIKGDATAIQGTIVTLWFYNQGEGAVGYEKGKEIAFQKMSQLHTAVKSGSMSMEQAAESIQNDAGLSQVDTAYKTNAIYKFNSVEQARITISKEFNDQLWKLKEGEISELYTGKDTRIDNDELIDAFYMFGQVTAKQGSSNVKNFDEWFAQKKQGYEITVY